MAYTTDCGIQSYNQLAIERMAIDDEIDWEGRLNDNVFSEVHLAMYEMSDFFTSEDLLAVLFEQSADCQRGERSIMDRITWAALTGDTEAAAKAKEDAIDYLSQAVLESPHTEDAVCRLAHSSGYQG